MKSVIPLLAAALLTTACSPPERVNPLLDDDPAAAAQWLNFWARSDYERLLLTDICAQYWAVEPPTLVPQQQASECDTLLSYFAKQVVRNGREGVVAEDLLLAPFWISYFEVREGQTELDERDRIQYEEAIRARKALGIPTD